jgi:hypothetical protein
MSQNYKNYLENFMVDFDFPKEAQIELSDFYVKVFSQETNLQGLKNILEAYKANKNESLSEMLSFSQQVSQKTNVSVYVMYALVLIFMAEVSKIHYQKKEISSSIWKDNFLDLKYKLNECKLVKGVWGIFVPEWYLGFFNVSRFSFGKLQFEITDFGYKYDKNGVLLNQESAVINIHIPRTGTRLTPQDVDDACETATQFFKEKYAILDPPVFVCNSWLLYPENKKVLKQTSNLYSFISRFEIIKVEEYPDYKETWRLFDCEYTGDPSCLPADSSFRRAYIDWMKHGKKTGWGYGVYVYKPINRIKGQ